MHDTLIPALGEALGSRLKTDVVLAPYTTFKIGGPAEYFIEVHSKDELAAAVTAARKAGMPFFVLAGGTNVLIADRGVRGLVIRNQAMKLTVKGIRGSIAGDRNVRITYLEAESGAPMNQVVRTTCDEGLSGLEMHLGLPGSVGGAVTMNSKWTRPRGYVGDCVHQAEILMPDGNGRIVPAAYFDFAYGSSRVQTNGDVILAVTFALVRKTRDEVWKTAEESLAYRRQSQPQGVKSAGCAFKNIDQSEALTAATPGGTTSAGYLIDHVGLKGTHVGGAVFSDVHANFIVNTGQATAADVVELMELARRRVFEKFRVTLKDEILKIGEFS
jgi:UDP-N-acetylenolpyruvoylglucosamine reductase